MVQKTSLIGHFWSLGLRLKSRAYTLIELLVVMAIISTLLSVLMPSLNRARFHAKTLGCMTHLRQWGYAVSMYANDNQGFLPSHTLPTGGMNTIDIAVGTKDAFERYGVTDEMWVCPQTPAKVINGIAKFNQFTKVWVETSLVGRETGYYLLPSYSWWVPRKINYPSGSAVKDFEFPAKDWYTHKPFTKSLFQKNAMALPIMTDVILKERVGPFDSPDLLDQPPVDYDWWKIIFLGRLDGVYAHHVFAGKIENSNQLYVDCHIQTQVTAEIRTRHLGRKHQNMF